MVYDGRNLVLNRKVFCVNVTSHMLILEPGVSPSVITRQTDTSVSQLRIEL